MLNSMATKVTKQEELKLAAYAECDPRTVASYAAGRPVRPMIAERIERAAKELGIRLPKRGKGRR